MSTLVDTNVLVRHLTGDPPEMAAAATRFLAEADDLLVVDLVIAEVVYVLESFYRVERARVAELVRSIVAFDAIRVQDEGLILRSIEIYEEHRLDYAEAYLCGCAEPLRTHSRLARVPSGPGTAGSSVASFDRSIDRVATIIRVEPRGA